MDRKAIEEVKKRLIQERERIKKQLEAMTEEREFNKDKIQVKWKDIGNKDEDNATELADYQDQISLERNLEISLEKIEKAIKIIDKGNYGKCEKCGKEIEKARLEAYPEATLCLTCKSSS
jgi:RNA polymerase-binding transcription factor DksA